MFCNQFSFKTPSTSLVLKPLNSFFGWYICSSIKEGYLFFHIIIKRIKSTIRVTSTELEFNFEALIYTLIYF